MILERRPLALLQWKRKNNLCSLAPYGPEVHLPLVECKIVQTLSVSNRKSENRIIALWGARTGASQLIAAVQPNID